MSDAASRSAAGSTSRPRGRQALRVRTPNATVYVMPWSSSDGIEGYVERGYSEEDLDKVTLATETVDALLELYPARAVDVFRTPGWVRL